MSAKKKDPKIHIEALKGIPKALVTFPVTLVRIFRDPNPSLSEMRGRRKELLSIIYACLSLSIIALIGIVIFTNVVDNETVANIINCINFITVPVIILCWLQLGKLKNVEVNLENRKCEKCGHIITYDDQVTFRELDRRYNVTSRESSETTSSDLKIVRATCSESVRVEVSCVCQKCGSTKTFTTSFTTLYVNKESRRVLPFEVPKFRLLLEEQAREEAKDKACSQEKLENEVLKYFQ